MKPTFNIIYRVQAPIPQRIYALRRASEEVEIYYFIAVRKPCAEELVGLHSTVGKIASGRSEVFPLLGDTRRRMSVIQRRELGCKFPVFIGEGGLETWKIA